MQVDAKINNIGIVKSTLPVRSPQEANRNMEVVQVAQTSMDPVEKMTLVEPVVTKDKQNDHAVEGGGNTAESNNHEKLNGDASKALEPEAIPQAPADESRPVDVAITTAPGSSVDEAPSTGADVAASLQMSPRAEVVTPAGTIDVVQEDRQTNSTTLTKVNDIETPTPAMETTAPPRKVEASTPKIEQNETTPTVPTTVTELAIATAPSTEKKSKIEKNQNDSFANAEILDEVQKFLTLHIAENRCSSHTKEINEFMAQHLNEKQRKRYFALLVERIVQHFTQEASTKGEDVSVDVQSNICLIEQMFLTLGRRSPLEDMYTAEEEEMLDLLFHSNSSNDLPINT